MSKFIELALIVLFIAMSAFFAASEVAFYSINKVKLHALIKQNKKGAKTLYRLKQHPKHVISTILVCNDFANISASSIATILATEMFGSAGIGIAIGIMTLVILVLGDMIPKNFANIYSEKTALATAPIIFFFMLLLSPFVSFLALLTKIFLRLFKMDKPREFSEEEIWTAIEMGAGLNIITGSEMRYLEGILRYKDVQAKEVMTPRVKIFALSENTPINEAVKKMAKKGYTRVPVYKESIDSITGFVHITDVLTSVVSKKPKRLSDIKRKILYSSEEMQAKQVFSEMQKKHVPIGVVLDEFGGTEGIVTMEDLLEEIVGEVLDENDPRRSRMKIIDSKTLIVSGDIKVEFVDSFFNTDVLTKTGNYPNIAAVIEEKLKKLPAVKDKIKVGNLYMQVLHVRKKFPAKIIIRHMPDYLPYNYGFSLEE